MTITSKWRQYIEARQRSGLSQAEYYKQQQINVSTFTARLSGYRNSRIDELLPFAQPIKS